jgi:hypothetical protein
LTIIFNHKGIAKTAINERDTKVVDMVIKFMLCATDSSLEWQQKILDDTPLILDLLSLPTNDHCWALLANLATHPGTLSNK